MSAWPEEIDGRAVTILDANAPAAYVGKAAWKGVVWQFTDELPEAPSALERRQGVQMQTFVREMALLAEHFGRDKPSDPLIERYFELVSENLTEPQFVQAAKAALTADLYWSQLIGYLIGHPVSRHIPAQVAYLAAFEKKNAIDRQGAELMEKLDLTLERTPHGRTLGRRS